MESYDRLKSELPEMADIVSQFPESVQGRVFDLLVAHFLGRPLDSSAVARVQAPPAMVASAVQTPPSHSTVLEDNIPGIAIRTADGDVRLVFKDPKASSSGDAAKRIAYVAIRTHELLTGQERVTYRNVVTPALASFRLTSGGIRNVLRADPGILKADGLAWLDPHAKDEADRFISEIQDRSTTGTWNPGAIRRLKRRRAEGPGNADEGAEEPAE